MICYERDFHDASSSFDDRIDSETELEIVEIDELENSHVSDGFYRHLDEY